MSTVGQVAERTDRPAYVRFARRPREDKKASLEQKRPVFVDVDYALVTPPYSKDVIEIKVDQWLERLDADVRADRLPKAWADNYRSMYDAFRNGQEIPLHGVPIKGWGVLSPAQQEMLVRINILTVEDLAGVNDEGCRRIGMGALDLKNKAVAWLKSMSDNGGVTVENAALKARVASLEAEVLTLKDQLRQALTSAAPQAAQQSASGISADDIMPEPEPNPRVRRK